MGGIFKDRELSRVHCSRTLMLPVVVYKYCAVIGTKVVIGRAIKETINKDVAGKNTFFVRPNLVIYSQMNNNEQFTQKIRRRFCYALFSCSYLFYQSWWRHHMKTFSAVLALCEGNPLVNDGFPSQRPVTQSFDVFFA